MTGAGLCKPLRKQRAPYVMYPWEESSLVWAPAQRPRTTAGHETHWLPRKAGIQKSYLPTIILRRQEVKKRESVASGDSISPRPSQVIVCFPPLNYGEASNLGLTFATSGRGFQNKSIGDELQSGFWKCENKYGLVYTDARYLTILRYIVRGTRVAACNHTVLNNPFL